MHEARLLLTVLLLLSAAPLAGQDVAVPVQVHYPLLLKILTFDRNLLQRVGDEITIAVLYQQRYRQSLVVKQSWQQEAATSDVATVMGVPFASVWVDLSQPLDLETTLHELGAEVLYVAPLRVVDLSSVTAISRKLGVLSVTGVPDYVEAGITVGVELQSSRPRIVINLAAARAEGADFASGLLNLARVVDPVAGEAQNGDL